MLLNEVSGSVQDASKARKRPSLPFFQREQRGQSGLEQLYSFAALLTLHANHSLQHPSSPLLTAMAPPFAEARLRIATS